MVVIINADDLGLNRPVNDAIFRLMDSGTVTSATLLANGSALEHAAAGTRRFPRCSFGAHLNLTQFKPMSTGQDLRPILDDQGNFRGNYIREISLGGELKRAIFIEWCAQIDRLIALGIRPSHIDSHHHTHTIPALLPILRRVRQKYGIQKARLSRNVYRPGEPLALRLKKSAYNLALRRFAGFRTTALFSGLDMFLETQNVSRNQAREANPEPEPNDTNAEPTNFRATPITLRAKSIELMVHPGAPNSDQESTQLLNWIHHLPPTARLISYHEL